MPRPTVIFAPFILALASVSAHAARQDGLVVYLTFDDANEPLKNFAPATPGRAPVEPVKVGDGLEPRFTEGRRGKAALFQGGPVGAPATKESANTAVTKDWALSLGNLDDVYAGNFTVSCWANVPEVSPGMIIGNKESFNIASGWSITSSYAKHYLINPLGGAPQQGYTPGLEKKWRHLVLVVNRDTGTADIYVDGKRDKNFKLPSRDAKLGEGLPTVIGASAKATFGTRCVVDEVGIWNRALTETEIAALGSGKRIPEASSYAWAGLGAAAATAAIVRRRRAKKSA